MPETLLLQIPSLRLLSAKNFKVMVQIELNKMTQNAEMEASTVETYHEYTALSCFAVF